MLLGKQRWIAAEARNLGSEVGWNCARGDMQVVLIFIIFDHLAAVQSSYVSASNLNALNVCRLSI